MRRAAAALLLALGAAPAAASAYEIDRRIIPQPKVRYYVALDDWRKPMDRVVKALNRAKVGVRLVKATIPEQASVQVGRLEQQCGFPGVNATTQTLVGGYAAIYLPYDCGGAQSSIIAAHELGHALGLKHENDRCALMNSSGTGRQSTPTQCLGERHPWLKKPWRPDDLAGMRKLYANKAPRATLRLTGPATVAAGQPVAFRATVKDAEGNLSEVRFDYGDGATDERLAGEALPTSHTYLEPGTYEIRATAVDFYLERDTATVKVRVKATG